MPPSFLELSKLCTAWVVLFHKRLFAPGCEILSGRGRLEVIGQDPVVIPDCAHNQASAMNLVEGLRRIFPNRSVTLILGVSQDKDKAGICRELDPITQTVIAAKADHPRAHWFTEDELKHFFPGKPFVRIAGIGPAIEAACRDAVPENIILIAGSVFLVSEARRYLKKKVVSKSKSEIRSTSARG